MNENPDSSTKQCECGHERGDHFRDAGNCMVETENETWACACPEFQMAESAENPDSLVSISFAWSWKSKDVTDLAIDGLYLDEYESDDLFVAVRDALTEWLTHPMTENPDSLEREES
jgi:hypothetical protein